MILRGKELRRLCVIILPLFLGTWIYFKGRESITWYESVLIEKKSAGTMKLANWLPDYLWCVSLLASVIFLWGGWNRIPLGWKIIIWGLISSTELLQYLHWIPGTGDWIDALFYQLAFITIYIFYKTKLI